MEERSIHTASVFVSLQPLWRLWLQELVFQWQTVKHQSLVVCDLVASIFLGGRDMFHFP